MSKRIEVTKKVNGKTSFLDKKQKDYIVAVAGDICSGKTLKQQEMLNRENFKTFLDTQNRLEQQSKGFSGVLPKDSIVGDPPSKPFEYHSAVVGTVFLECDFKNDCTDRGDLCESCENNKKKKSYYKPRKKHHYNPWINPVYPFEPYKPGPWGLEPPRHYWY